MKKIIIGLFGVLIFLVGALLVLYPFGREGITELKNSRMIEKFLEERESTAEDLDNKEPPDARLRSEMESYNQQIYEEQQAGLCDAWSYQHNIFDFSETGIVDDMIGYIAIEAMGIALPLYIGANTENMSKGAVVLSQTSMPLGGTNTNCVIAAHRGWKGSAMFRDIEMLQPGDEVIVTNLWESLYYEVVKIIVIDPADIHAVKIVEEADMITLMTCHPYTRNYQRYVVYCSRKNGDLVRQTDLSFEGESYTSSKNEIQKERNVSLSALILLGVGITVPVIVLIVRKRFG